VELNEEIALTSDDADQILAINEALDKLSTEDAQKAELVKLRYFAGLTLQEAADALGISRATASRYWEYAKVFLFCALEDDSE
jgi:RNA polymerase sigma factor (sigma-70 family)